MFVNFQKPNNSKTLGVGGERELHWESKVKSLMFNYLNYSFVG